MKRVFDVLCSLLFVSVFWPFYIIIGLLIRCVSPGKAIYCAKRVGKNGKVFTLYKYRTMRMDSGEVKITTLENDDRIFPLGKFLRKSKIDETLQIFNILKSDMSIVGFRPEDVVNSSEIFKGKYREILNIKPGLTSPASLFDYTHGEKTASEEEYITSFLPIKMEMELYYVQNQSFLYDLELIVRTVIIIILRVFGKQNFKYPKEYRAVMEKMKKENDYIKKEEETYESR